MPPHRKYGFLICFLILVAMNRLANIASAQADAPILEGPVVDLPPRMIPHTMLV
jgi:hypothetical protein